MYSNKVVFPTCHNVHCFAMNENVFVYPNAKNLIHLIYFIAECDCLFVVDIKISISDTAQLLFRNVSFPSWPDNIIATVRTLVVLVNS